MTFDELTKLAEKEWTTEGPGSGGGTAGYFLYNKGLYFYGYDSAMPEPYISGPQSIESFLEQFRSSENLVIQQIIHYLKDKE